MLENYNNYGPYVTLAKGEDTVVDIRDLNSNTWDLHFKSILNILRDGIDSELIQKSFITIKFNDVESVQLSVMDYFNNLILWRTIIKIYNKVEPKHILFKKNTTRDVIKKYIDKFIIEPNRNKVDNRTLNNIIDDTLWTYTIINEFSLYLANTINLEDDIRLMKENREAWEIYHTSLKDFSLEEVKTEGMRRTQRLSEIIKDTDYHCLADFFRANEGINIKQYREYAVNIGTKPDGEGGVFPIIIDSSYIRGGLQDIPSLFIESRAGRTAQILSKTNVGDSGHFARLLGLNNSDTILNQDPNYVCDSKNFQILTIENDKMLKMLHNRYYRLTENGLEFKIDCNNDKFLIGSTILLRSPMTCSSKAHGHGVCYRCYGDLAYTNNDINIGKLAAELLSSTLTQILLSAKHLLESLIRKIVWTTKFEDYFTMDANIIYVQDDIDIKGVNMLIDPDKISLESEHDDFEYNEFISEFEIQDRHGHIYNISSSEADDMYISGEFNDIIRKYAAPNGDKISIPLGVLQGVPLFLVKIHNNELSRTLNKLKDIINKNKVTKGFDRHQILQAFLSTILEGNLSISSVHCEVLISNQIRSTEDVLEEPNWDIPNVPYQILTLNQALQENPSVIVSMSYQRLSKTLYNPLTFRKNKASFMDLFFLINPAKYMNKNFEGEMK